MCDEYAGDPDADTVEWRDRDANNVVCSYQRHQVAIEGIEFATVTATPVCCGTIG